MNNVHNMGDFKKFFDEKFSNSFFIQKNYLRKDLEDHQSPSQWDIRLSAINLIFREVLSTIISIGASVAFLSFVPASIVWIIVGGGVVCGIGVSIGGEIMEII